MDRSLEQADVLQAKGKPRVSQARTATSQDQFKVERGVLGQGEAGGGSAESSSRTGHVALEREKGCDSPLAFVWGWELSRALEFAVREAPTCLVRVRCACVPCFVRGRLCVLGCLSSTVQITLCVLCAQSTSSV